MAFAVFLRGVNVGGHRTFRPKEVASALGRFDVVNVGAAGTFVVRGAVSQAGFRKALLAEVPFETEVVSCAGADLLGLERENPFGAEGPGPGVVRFLTILGKAGSMRTALPVSLPEGECWLVRLVGLKKRFVFGEYRRDMKTIRYLGQIDKLFGAAATTRNWNTVEAVLRILKGEAG